MIEELSFSASLVHIAKGMAWEILHAPSLRSSCKDLSLPCDPFALPVLMK